MFLISAGSDSRSDLEESFVCSMFALFGRGFVFGARRLMDTDSKEGSVELVRY